MPWSEWDTLGGKIMDDPAAVSWGPDRIDVFGPDWAGHLMHKAWEAGWHEWEDLGAIEDGPGVSSWNPGRLDVFAGAPIAEGPVSWHQLGHRAWDGDHWTEWDRPRTRAFKSSPAAVSWGPGRIDVFAR